MMLGEFIRDAASMRFSWSRYGCAALPAAWVQQLTGVDPLATLPNVNDETGVAGVLSDAGGMAALWDRQIAEIGQRCPLAMGAIGIATMPDGMEMGGVVSETRWIFLTESGIRAMLIPPHRVVATWGPYG